MAAPLSSVSSGAGGIRVVFEPPLEFIAKQAGAFGARLLDFEPLWARFAPIMEAQERDQFASEGHGEWPALAESTALEKERYGWPSDIMIRTGTLRDSLVNPDQAMDAGPMQMSWGTDVDYAHWHQDGGTIAGRPPQRKLVEVRPEDRVKFEAAMLAWINEVARETF